MPEIAEKFVKGLEEHVDDEVRLKWALHYTQVKTMNFWVTCFIVSLEVKLVD